MSQQSRTRSLFGLYLFNFFRNTLLFGSLGVPFFLDRAGLDYERMFTLEMLFSVALFLFEIPTGIVADRYGRKASLLIGSIVFSFGFLLFGIVTDFGLLALAEIVCALGMTLLSGADRALLYEVIVAGGVSEKARAIMARYDACAAAGMMVGFPAGSMLVGSGLIEYRMALGLVFALTGVSVLIGASMLTLVQEPGRAEKGEASLREGVRGVRYIFEHRGLRPFALNFAAISSLTFFMFWFYQSLVLSNGLAVGVTGWVGASMNGLALVLLSFSRRIEKALGLSFTLFLTSFIPGMLYLLLAVDHTMIPAGLAIYGVAGLRSLRTPLLQSLMNEHIDSRNRATVLSGVAMLERVLTAILYPIVGWLADASLGRSFLLLGVVTAALALVLRVNPRLASAKPSA